MFLDRDAVRCRAHSDTQGTLSLLVILLNIAVFIAQNLMGQLQLPAFYQQYALSVDGLRQGHLWQLITFQFLHLPLDNGGVFHLLGDVFFIYVFGRRLERVLGKSDFLLLYLMAGMLGGIMQMAGVLFSPARFGLAVVGASAGACGLIAAYATLFPAESLSFFFVPVPMRARTLLWIGILTSVLGLTLPSHGIGMAHGAHLGGLLAGILIAQRLARCQPRLVLSPAGGKTPLSMKTALD